MVSMIPRNRAPESGTLTRKFRIREGRSRAEFASRLERLKAMSRPATFLVLGAALGCAKPNDSTVGYSAGMPGTPTAPHAAPSAEVEAGVASIRTPTAKIARCERIDAVHLSYSPAVPVAGKPLRVIATSAEPFQGTLTLGSATSTLRRGGPPYFWMVEVPAAAAGDVQASFSAKDCSVQPPPLTLSLRTSAPGLYVPKTMVWTTQASWSRQYEELYAAWIEALFDTEEKEALSVPALHEIVRDRKRNFLFDHLGAHEDSDRAPILKPDCADLPYVLRAYFAFKFHLPFAMAECSRGGGDHGPTCKGILTNADPPAKEPSTPLRGFATFIASTVADRVHSGSARTAFEDEESDYYPVPLTWDALRPGTVYADPYGHVLMVTKRIAAHDGQSGLLFAVDGQPDGTVAKKRFWRGTFLYTHEPELGGPGFKRFRPVVYRGGTYRRLKNAEINASPEYGDLSLAPGTLQTDAFYDAVDDALSSEPVDAYRALTEVVEALHEQVRTRVTSVENGRKFLETAKTPAPMPEGAQVFETEGAWEDFSTPSRDLRLLIALDVVKDFPARVARRIERYRVPQGKTTEALKAELETQLLKELAERSVEYTRTDGSTTRLTLLEVTKRTIEFEMTYNPNDCVEVRWGAAEGSDERSTCKAHAPAEQRAQMNAMRTWFHARKRPTKK